MYHYTIVELLKEEVNLEEEQTKLDDHDDKITDFVSHLQLLAQKRVSELVKESVTTTPPALGRQLDCIKRKITGVQDCVEAAQLRG